MQLILAIDSDPRRSEQLAALVRAKLKVDLVQAPSAGEGLHALKDRVPDLILTAPLLSPFDDGVLDEYLRDLGSAATHVQTVRIPMLSATPKKKSARSLFGLGRKKKQTSSATPDGCDPMVFADEIAHYLTRSAEERSASAKAAAEKAASARHTPAPEARYVSALAAEPVDEPLVAEPLIEEFIEPVYEPEPIVAAPEPEPVFVETRYTVEETEQVETRYAVEEPEQIETRYAVVETEPIVDEPVFDSVAAAEVVALYETIVMPEPVAKSEPVVKTRTTVVKPDPVVEPDPVVVAPLPATEPTAVSKPDTQTSGTSSSFEAALAAIRAAWVKPETQSPVTPPASAPVDGRPKPLGAGSAEVDLTTEIDALEDVVGADGPEPAADDESSPDESKTPADRRTLDKSRKRPEKARGRKMRGPDGRDEPGVFDPKQYGFSALVNKLDEVTEDDVVTARATTIVR